MGKRIDYLFLGIAITVLTIGTLGVFGFKINFGDLSLLGAILLVIAVVLIMMSNKSIKSKDG